MASNRKTLDVSMMEDFKSQLQNTNVARGKNQYQRTL